MKTTFTNSFHNTKTTVQLPANIATEYQSQTEILNQLWDYCTDYNIFHGPTPPQRKAYKQYKRIEKKLCGAGHNCKCGIVR